jgi:hypothetical protein
MSIRIFRRFIIGGSDSAPSEVRKRGSRGGYPRKHDDLLTGPSDSDIQSRHLWSSKLQVTARRAKRENGGLGEDPPGSTMTY